MQIGIIGSGPMGVSLAINFSKNTNITLISLYSRNQNTVDTINNDKRSIFQNIVISLKIVATLNLFNVLQNSQIIFIAVNSLGFRNVIEEIAQVAKDNNRSLDDKFFIICTKGLDENCGFFYDIALKILKTENIGLLLGPSFASEIAEGEKTRVNLVHRNLKKNEKIILDIVNENTNLKIIPTTDCIGAQICSIMKNICAIYLGIVKGLGFKNDYMAALFTNFMKEIRIAIRFYGGDENTIFELCGLGDIFLTCTSFESRNYKFGYNLGLNKSVEKSIAESGGYYPEGYYSLKNFHQMNIRSGLKLPICEKLYENIFIKGKIGQETVDNDVRNNLHIFTE